METIVKVFKLVIAIVGGVIANALGGFDGLVRFYITLACIDYALGWLKGIKAKNVSSAIAFWGLNNKIIVLCLIGVAFQLDVIFKLDYLRNTVIIWFCICEGASILENSAYLGLPVPDGVLDILIQVKKGFNINLCEVVKKIISDYNVDKGGNKQ